MKLLVNTFFLILAASAVSAADFKLGVVDFQQALNGVEEGKAAKAKLKNEYESKMKVVEAKQKDFDAKKAKFDKLQAEIAELQKQAQSGLLKADGQEKGRKLEGEFRKQLEEITELDQTIQKTRMQYQKEMGEKEAKETDVILTKLKAIVADIGRKDGLSMVLEASASGLVYASDPVMLTEKVIQKYNSTHKGGDTKEKK
ncbi:MAG: OmpH family outer membrane protein [Deltaproteobacteria bacterium]|nr:OmpH family outer membrane protein [Deltaproteobacteria bacterium]